MSERDLAVESATLKVKQTYPDNRILMMYLTGSRLYGYYTEESDYDLVVYVMPTERELMFGKMISAQLAVGENKVDSVTVKDIRLIVKDLSKPNVNTLMFLRKPIYWLESRKIVNLLKGIDEATKHSLDVNRKNLSMSMLGAVRANKKKDRVPLTLLLFHLSCFLLINMNKIDIDVVNFVANQFKDRTELDEDFTKLEENLFSEWKQMYKPIDDFDYEKMIMDSKILELGTVEG